MYDQVLFPTTMSCILWICTLAVLVMFIQRHSVCAGKYVDKIGKGQPIVTIFACFLFTVVLHYLLDGGGGGEGEAG